jgi:hypothetical protein
MYSGFVHFTAQAAESSSLFFGLSMYEFIMLYMNDVPSTKTLPRLQKRTATKRFPFLPGPGASVLDQSY